MQEVNGLEEYLLVSKNGKVFSKDRYILNNGRKILKHGKEMKPRNNGLGYFQIKITIDNEIHQRYLHRIVAETFIPNPLKLEDINHIDGNKKNNNVENLEWCSHSNNIKHALNNGLLNRKPNGKFSKTTLNQAESTLSEGAETI